MIRLLVIILIFVTSLASAQLFDSIGGTLKDADLGGTLGTTPATTPTGDTSYLNYQVDPAVTSQVIEEFITNMKGLATGTPEQVAEAEKAIRENINREAMQQFIDQLFVGEGFKLDNVADVFAMYLIASFVVINDMQNGTTTEQDLIVRDQVIAAFNAVPDMKTLSDADKQKFSETLILYIMILANDWQQALQGAEGYDLETVKTQTRDTMVQVGIDPAQFDFTPQGLIRKGAGGQTPQTQTPQTQTPQTQTPQTQTPQGNTANLTPEELEALPQCQQIVANPDAVKQVENGETVLKFCQELVAKAGSTTTPTPTTNTQTPTTQTQTPTTQTPTTQNNPLGGSDPANPLAGGTADPFAGSFSGDNITLTLQGANGTYTGELTFNGQSFPVQASANGTNLTGTFTSGGTTFNFTASLQDKNLTLTSDGSNFNLVKQ